MNSVPPREPPRWLFPAILGISGIVIFFTFRDYSMTPDEEGHIAYGYSIVQWYTSLFEDRRIFSWTNIWLYGGFYDVLSHFIVQISPINIIDTRHFFNAMFGLLGVVGVYKIGCLLGSRWTGVLAALFLILTPRYYGHTFNNHKDMPIAVLYLWSLYGQIKILIALPNLSKKWIVVTGVLTGLAMGIRVGSVILLLFFGISLGIRYIQLFWSQAHHLEKIFKQYFIQIITISLLAYFTMLLFWPWAQTNPLTHPFNALTSFLQFQDIHPNFFEGRYYLSTQIPWYYAPKWLLWTLPEFIFSGLTIGMGCLLYDRRRINVDYISVYALLLISVLAPLCYAAVSHTPLYNGLRHLLFTIPPLTILGAVGFATGIATLPGRLRLATGILLVGLMAVTLREMVLLHPNQYVYFNYIFAGGIQQAGYQYDTDYWNNSYKQGIRWLEKQPLPAKQKVRIASDNSDIRFLFRRSDFEYVENPEQADFFMVSTKLERHRVLPGEKIHTITARGLPLLYIFRPDESFRNDPFFSGTNILRLSYQVTLLKKSGKNAAALEACLNGLKLNEQDPELHAQIADLYFEAGQYLNALKHYQAASKLNPPSPDFHWRVGETFYRLENFEKAEFFYHSALEMQPYFLKAHHALGMIYRRQNQNEKAIIHFRHIVDILPESVDDWHNLGVCYYRTGQLLKAAKAYQTLIQKDPENQEAYINLAIIQKEQEHFEKAIGTYRTAIRKWPHRDDIKQALDKLIVHTKQSPLQNN